MLKRISTRIILLIIGIVLGYLISEFLVIRLEKKGVIKIDRSIIDDNRIFSEGLIYKRKPYSSSNFRLGEYQNYWGINKYGFRDGDYSMKKPKNTFRIIVLGDSITAGGGVDAAQSFPKILESRLNRERSDTVVYEVMNMGVNGYGPVNYTALYKELGAKFSPDLVIVGFYLGNDPGDIISYKLKQKEIYLSSIPDKIIPFSVNQTLKERSTLWLFLMQKYYGWVKRYEVDVEKVMFQGDSKGHAFFDTHIKPSAYIEEGWKIAGEQMSSLLKQTKDKNVDLIVVGLPTRSAVDPEEWKRIKEKGHNVDSRLYEDPASHTRFLKMCQAEDISCLDLQNPIKSYKSVNDLFLGTDNHFSPQGNWLVADSLLPLIK